MYRPAESADWCQCCMRGVTFTDAEGASDFFGNHNTTKVVYPSNNSCCGARHLPASTALLGICRPRPLAQVAPPATGGAPIAPQLLSYIFLLYSYFRCYRIPWQSAASTTNIITGITYNSIFYICINYKCSLLQKLSLNGTICHIPKT